MTRITTVLFDLDGTIIDSVRLILDSYHHTLATHGLDAKSDDYWLAGLGTPLRVQFRPWADDPPRLEAMIATYREYNLAHHDSRVTAYPGVVEMVRKVKSAGLRTGLVTSKNSPGARRGLRVVGLEEAMELVIGAEDVQNPKPHPEPIELALRRLGQTAEEAIYVGDSTHDMESGRAARVLTAAALWGPFDRAHLAATAPDYWLETPGDLLTIVGL
ncbi:MAG: HAD-IA family hydrolase [Gemmatimonadales bacterium]|nr:HAD-IA family hydrolase [Gemmatimonadales bacterium]